LRIALLPGDGVGPEVTAEARRAVDALGLSLADINATLSATWGSAYVNDFIDRGRTKRVYMQGDAPYRMQPSDIDLFIPHQANIRIIEAVAKGLSLPMDRMYINLDKYGNTSAASVPIALAEAVNEGRVQVGDHVTIVAFGAGFTSGAVTLQWTADPSRGAIGESAVNPSDVHVRLPVDWDSVDPIPPALAELMNRPGPVDVPLDDVVPGEPEDARQPVGS